MDMINVFWGKNSYLVNKKLEETINKLGVEIININKYNLIENDFYQVIEDLRTISFFSEKKIVVINQIDEILKEDKKLIIDFINYLDKPNPDVYLFIISEKNIDESNEVYKSIFKNAYIEEVSDITDDEYPKYIKKIVENDSFNITDIAIKELILRTKYDLDLISQELEKLKLFNYDSKKIDSDSVVLLVSRSLEENIYELTNAIIERNINKAVEIYYDLLAKNEKPIKIINNITNKIRELIQAKTLLEDGASQEDLMNYFKISSGSSYYLKKNAKEVERKILEKHLKNLSKLDYEIKSGRVEQKLGLEIFILGV